MAQRVEDWVALVYWTSGSGARKSAMILAMCVGMHVPYEELSFKRVQRHFKSIGCLHKNKKERTETECRPQSHKCQLKPRMYIQWLFTQRAKTEADVAIAKYVPQVLH